MLVRCPKSPTKRHQYAYDGDHVTCVYCLVTRELPRGERE
jgi:hypothetical protein